MAIVQTVDIGGVRLTTDGIQPVGGNLATLNRREDVRDVTLRYGVRSPHPFLEFLFGVALVTPGYFVVCHFLSWFMHGGAFVDVEALMAVPAILGVTLVLDPCRRGYFLIIRRTRGTAKIAFDHGTSLIDADQFRDALRGAVYTVICDTVR